MGVRTSGGLRPCTINQASEPFNKIEHNFPHRQAHQSNKMQAWGDRTVEKVPPCKLEDLNPVARTHF